VVDVPDTVQV